MKVYHGSIEPVIKPDVTKSQKFLDFGPGFYVTKFEEQAQRWAKRKALRKHGNPTVSSYKLDEFAGFKVNEFSSDSDWLDFVCSCRRGEDVYKDFDIVVGNVANDDVFKSVDMYYKGIWDKDRTLEEIKFFKKSNQIAFLNQKAIEKCLSFIDSYILE